jgi:gamma-glutamylputrescine oxidase
MLTLRSIERAGPTGEDVRAYPLSYYAATTPTFFNGAALDQDVQADACIIGGATRSPVPHCGWQRPGDRSFCWKAGPSAGARQGATAARCTGLEQDQAWLARRLGQDSARALWTMARTARDHLDRLIALDPDRCDFRPA